jgi:hypothetical protein
MAGTSPAMTSVSKHGQQATHESPIVSTSDA